MCHPTALASDTPVTWATLENIVIMAFPAFVKHSDYIYVNYHFVQIPLLIPFIVLIKKKYLI